VLAVELDATLGRRSADSRLRFGGRILLVGDDAAMLQQLERLLLEGGLGPLMMTSGTGRALGLFRELNPDVVLLDVNLATVDPLPLIRQMNARVPDTEFLPIVVLAADATPEQKQQLLAEGVCDIVDRKNGLPDLPPRLQNVLRIRDLTGALEQRVTARTAMFRATEVELVNRLAVVAELGDYGDASHVQRVGRTSALLAAQLGLGPEEVQLIRHAAPLHDIGKIAIPDAILLKTDALSLEEWDTLKTHTTIGARLLADSIAPVLQIAEGIALYHHESWDGTGYAGVAGEDIPLAGRIACVADVFDALTHERPYKSAWSAADSVDWMRTMRGQRFDPRVLDALVEVSRVTDLTDLGTDAGPLISPRINVAARAAGKLQTAWRDKTEDEE
jgi:putative two-component system response regulator